MCKRMIMNDGLQLTIKCKPDNNYINKNTT